MNTSQKLGIGALIAGSLGAGAFGGQQLQLAEKEDCEIPIQYGEDKQICVTAEEYAAVEAYLKGEATVKSE